MVELRRIRAVCATVALSTLAACGSSSGNDATSETDATPATADEPAPSTSPATTEPATTEPAITEPAITEPAITEADQPEDSAAPSNDSIDEPASTEGNDTVDEPSDDSSVNTGTTTRDQFTRRFVSMDVIDGWTVVTSTTSPIHVESVAEFEDGWSLDLASIEPLVELRNDDVTFGIQRDPSFITAPDLPEWRQAVRSELEQFGDVGEASPTPWANVEDGESMLITGANDAIFWTGTIADQYVLAGATGQPTDQQVAEIRQMIDSVQFDPTVLFDADHSVEIVFETSAAGPTFTARAWVPASWQADPTAEGLRWIEPLTGGYVEVTVLPSQGGLDATVDLATGLGLLDGPFEREDQADPTSGVKYAILWDGEPDVTGNAMVLTDDGTYASLTLVRTARNLLDQTRPSDGALIATSVSYASES